MLLLLTALFLRVTASGRLLISTARRLRLIPFARRLLLPSAGRLLVTSAWRRLLSSAWRLLLITSGRRRRLLSITSAWRLLSISTAGRLLARLWLTTATSAYLARNVFRQIEKQLLPVGTEFFAFLFLVVGLGGVLQQLVMKKEPVELREDQVAQGCDQSAAKFSGLQFLFQFFRFTVAFGRFFGRRLLRLSIPTS